MKVFQVYEGFCHWDATPVHPTLESTQGRYAPDIVFVEAPDFVFEGWGYDESAQGDQRFIKPTPPEGWLYDESTGVFFPLEAAQPAPDPEAGQEETVKEAICSAKSAEEPAAVVIDYAGVEGGT